MRKKKTMSEEIEERPEDVGEPEQSVDIEAVAQPVELPSDTPFGSHADEIERVISEMEANPPTPNELSQHMQRLKNVAAKLRAL